MRSEAITTSPLPPRLSPEPEQIQFSSYRSRMSLISPRRLSVSLVGSLGQLDIPFKQKRKAPVISSVDQETVNNMKLRLINKRKVTSFLLCVLLCVLLSCLCCP